MSFGAATEVPAHEEQRLKVLISAYACEPGKGSEPGVGWNVARGMATHHDVWVLTRSNNRPAIEAALEVTSAPGLRFLYFDLPRWLAWWKRGGRGVQLYYYLWQVGALGVARKAHRQVQFDLGHHATFVKYWSPSFLAWLGIPYLWGPVGGGESSPRAFLQGFSPQGRRYEWRRESARRLAERDPLVRLTARRCELALATTRETQERVVALGARDCEVMTQVALNDDEIAMPTQSERTAGIRFLSIGNLLHWKGFHLGIQAFAASGLSNAEYWIVGDGPERTALQSLAGELGVASAIKFTGALPRQQVMAELKNCVGLLHPSLHDSGGFVCLEAMAVGTPVLCLKLGGPAKIVSTDCGFVVDACAPGQVIGALGAAMRSLAGDACQRKRMGEAAVRRAGSLFTWDRKCRVLDGLYRRIAADARCAR